MGCPRRCWRAALVEQICGGLVGRCSSLGAERKHGGSLPWEGEMDKQFASTWDAEMIKSGYLGCFDMIVFKVFFGEYSSSQVQDLGPWKVWHSCTLLYILLYQLCITWPHSFERRRHDDIRVLRGYQAASRAMLWFDAAIFLADAECAKPLTAWGCYAQVNDPGLQVRDDNCFKKLLAKWRSIQCTFLPILLRISCKLLFSRRLWCRLNRFWLSI